MNLQKLLENNFFLGNSILSINKIAEKLIFSMPIIHILKDSINLFLPATASCMMKKFILDFGFLPHCKAARTAELPKTMRMNSNQRIANCSV